MIKTIKRRCTVCGVVYGEFETELSPELSKLTESHGYCPECGERVQAELDRELAEVERRKEP